MICHTKNHPVIMAIQRKVKVKKRSVEKKSKTNEFFKKYEKWHYEKKNARISKFFVPKQAHLSIPLPTNLLKYSHDIYYKCFEQHI